MAGLWRVVVVGWCGIFGLAPLVLIQTIIINGLFKVNNILKTYFFGGNNFPNLVAC